MDNDPNDNPPDAEEPESPPLSGSLEPQGDLDESDSQSLFELISALVESIGALLAPLSEQSSRTSEVLAEINDAVDQIGTLEEKHGWDLARLSDVANEHAGQLSALKRIVEMLPEIGQAQTRVMVDLQRELKRIAEALRQLRQDGDPGRESEENETTSNSAGDRHEKLDDIEALRQHVSIECGRLSVQTSLALLLSAVAAMSALLAAVLMIAKF